MMSDRELLELAAKAAGIRLTWLDGMIPKNSTGAHPMSNVYGMKTWDPLRDDGAALHLLHAIYRKSGVDDWIMGYDNLWGGSLEDTRRAIVRSAAEIGRSMK